MNTRKFFVRSFVRSLMLVGLLFPALVFAEGDKKQKSASASETKSKYCKIGGDPLDLNRKKYMEPGEKVFSLEKDTPVLMRGRSKDYTCILKKDEKVVSNENDTSALPWVYACGNTILKASFINDVVKYVAPDGHILLQLSMRPMWHVQFVDGTNAKARLMAEQVKFGFGLSANWHFGLEGTRIFQNQSQQQTADAKANAGSSSSSKVNVVNNNPNPPNDGGGVTLGNDPPNSGSGGDGVNLGNDSGVTLGNTP